MKFFDPDPQKTKTDPRNTVNLKCYLHESNNKHGTYPRVSVEFKSCILSRLICAGGGEVVESLAAGLQDLTHVLAEPKFLPNIQVNLACYVTVIVERI